ncbi:MAG: flagellar motor stator protein MotA [candidate division Zixibacteria bacterium]|nr:flagellar motor stator protein MotA [candidate division Zixibacteria bacterium]
MIAIVGLIIVMGSVIGGFILAKGHLMVLVQPSEFLIIGGAAIGSMLVMAPMKTLKGIFSQLLKILGSGPSKKTYIELLVMMYELFNVARKDGLVGLESHVENPDKSSVITKYPYFLKNHHALNFLADTMRLIIMGGIPEHDLEAMMDMDLETHHHEEMQPSTTLQTVGDSLPGLGIVAAVLGVVITMGSIGGAVEEVGHHVAAALVGTFLGILLSYGVALPLANKIRVISETEGHYYVVLKQALLAFHKGFTAQIAVEFARRVISNDVRPSFVEVEEACRAAKSGK